MSDTGLPAAAARPGAGAHEGNARAIRIGVLTVSDRRSRGEGEDEGGPLVETILTEARVGEIVARAVVPDEREEIEAALVRWCDDERLELIVTTGGTGLGPRDVTPEATLAVIDREVPGMAEAMRAHGLRITPYAALARQVVGQRGSTLIVNLPGSLKAVEEGLDPLLPILPHAVEMVRGGGPVR